MSCIYLKVEGHVSCMYDVSISWLEIKEQTQLKLHSQPRSQDPSIIYDGHASYVVYGEPKQLSCIIIGRIYDAG